MTWVASDMTVFADRTRAQVVADVDFGTASVAEKQRRATLIAAAPDLLEALDWLVGALKSGTMHTTPGLMSKADAAIAKATAS